MKHFLILLLAVILCSVFSSQKTVFASAPAGERIISLSPQVTELLYSLGLGNRIVAVSEYSDHPPEAKLKPRIGSMLDPSLESILALRPDTAVMDANVNPPGLKKKLIRFGIKVIVFRAGDIAQLPGAIKKLGVALNSPKKADKLARRIQNVISKVKLKAKKNHPGKKVIFLISPNPLIAAGRGTPIDDALKMLGWRNIASRAGTSYPRYSLEELIVQSPDIIIIGIGHSGMMNSWKRLLKRLYMLKAVKRKEICYMGDSLYQLGPEIINGIRELSLCLK